MLSLSKHATASRKRCIAGRHHADNQVMLRQAQHDEVEQDQAQNGQARLEQVPCDRVQRDHAQQDGHGCGCWKASAPVSVGSEPDTSFAEGEHGAPNTDATPHIAVDSHDNFLALFQSEGNGYLRGLVLERGRHVRDWRVHIRRTDLISVLMMRDRTILVHT
ncbi:MAG: hypothetical protein AMXMBFR61_16940 [Fimbriimonadales bacterium]